MYLLSVSEETEQAGVLNELAYLLWQSNSAQSIEYAEKALLLSEKYNLIHEKYKALNNLALAWQQHDTLNVSLQYNMQALEVARKINEPVLIARAYFELGSNYSGKGYYEKALENLLQSFKIIEDLYNRGDTVKNKRRLSYLTNNIAIVFGRMGDKEKAIAYYEISLEMKTMLKDSTGIANVFNNLGLIYAEQGEFKKAESYYRQSLDIKRKMANKEDIAETVLNRWELMIHQKQFDKALVYFDSVYIYYPVFKSRSKVIMLNNIASVYLALEQAEKAQQYLKKAIALSERIHIIDVLTESYRLLSEYYAQTAQYKQAYAFQLKYIQLNDSVMNSAMASKMAEMQTRYETEKKERQIAILQKDKQLNQAALERQKAIKLLYGAISLIVIIIAFILIVWIRSKQQRKNEKLEKRNLENEQKLLRAQMNPHFIFNSLNTVQGFISSNDSFKAMGFLSKFGRLLRNILENSRENLINLENEIETLRLYIEMEKLRYKDIFDFQIIIDKELDTGNILIPPLIIQPFVENAIKHGLAPKQGAGHLVIEVKREKSLLQIIIRDNGVGRKKTGKISHTERKSHKSFGIQLTRERLESHGKSMEQKASFTINDLHDEKGESKGTEVVLSIPYNNSGSF
jgi:sensor histidine kinase YesM